jgi:hypothetical protein
MVTGPGGHAGMGLTITPRAVSRGRPARRALIGVLAAGLVATAGFAAGHHRSGPTAPASAEVGSGPVKPLLLWAEDGPWPVPRSATEGPARLSEGAAGVPVGYAHDALGAALAAINISQQLTSDVGPVMAAQTARSQTYGDATSTLALVDSSPTGGSTPPTELLYKIIGGDPSSDRVELALAERTAESSAAGGYAVTDRELRWIAGDWRMALPEPGAVIQSALPGFVSLGGPPRV